MDERWYRVEAANEDEALDLADAWFWAGKDPDWHDCNQWYVEDDESIDPEDWEANGRAALP